MSLERPLVNHERVFFLLLIIWLLSLTDWAMTIDAIEMGIAEEGNPFAARFLSAGLWWSLLWKTGIATFGCLSLWLTREYRIAVFGAYFCAIAYIVLTLYHVAIRLVTL